MRILLFTDTLGDVNGVARFVGALAAHARTRGFDLRVVTSTRKPVTAGANIVNVPPRWAGRLPGYVDLDVVWPRGRALGQEARTFRPEVIHVSTPGPVGLCGRGLARRLGVPLVGTHHTDFPSYAQRLIGGPAPWTVRRALAWFYAPCACVLARSQASERSVRALGVAPGRVRVLRPGVDTAHFRAGRRAGEAEARASFWRAYPGVLPHAVKVLYCGRLSAEKGVGLLLAAWRRASGDLARTGVPAQLLIIGDGPGRTSVRETAAGLPSVMLLGTRFGDELANLYAHGDLFVFPSATDTLGQVVLEAQASGLPALVTDQGGPREVVRDGETGLVLPAHDARAWAGAIARLVGDEGARARMGRAAHAHMRAHDIARSMDDFWDAHASVARASAQSCSASSPGEGRASPTMAEPTRTMFAPSASASS